MDVEARGEVALWLTVAFIVVALFLRAAYHKWRFGSSGLVGLRKGPGSSRSSTASPS